MHVDLIHIQKIITSS